SSDNSQHTSIQPPKESLRQRILKIIAPYPNLSSFLLHAWFWRWGKKTQSDFDNLVEGVLLHPEFTTEDLRGVNFEKLGKVAARGEVKEGDEHLDQRG
ncbi:hypothetical protein BDN72DRAFT_739372, partial [Pluteus cervinus]